MSNMLYRIFSFSLFILVFQVQLLGDTDKYIFLVGWKYPSLKSIFQNHILTLWTLCYPWENTVNNICHDWLSFRWQEISSSFCVEMKKPKKSISEEKQNFRAVYIIDQMFYSTYYCHITCLSFQDLFHLSKYLRDGKLIHNQCLVPKSHITWFPAF